VDREQRRQRRIVADLDVGRRALSYVVASFGLALGGRIHRSMTLSGTS